MRKLTPMIFGLILLIFSVWLQVTSIEFIRNFIARLEKVAYDTQLRTKIFTMRKQKENTVVVVDIDDKTLKDIGRWPWPRSKLAELITELQNQGAVIIALDMMFPEPEENIVNTVLQAVIANKLNTPQIEETLKKIQPNFNSDQKFADSLGKSDTVIGISFLPQPFMVGEIPKPLFTLTTSKEKNLGLIQVQGVLGNISLLGPAAKSSGFVNFFADPDGIIRRVPLLLRFHDNVYPSLPLEAVRLYLLTDVKLVTAPYENEARLEGIQVGNHLVPTDAASEVIIPFRGRSYTLPYFSATDVLHHRVPNNAFAGKIVFIGTSATGLGDLQPTAIQSSFPGVEIQATIASGILSDTFPYRPDWATGAEIFITIALGLILILTFPFFGPLVLTLLMVLIPVGLIVANNFLWTKTGLIISNFIPLVFTIIFAMVNIVYGYLFESRRRERLKAMFGQYVPEKHIDEMLKSSGSYALYGEDRVMTVLFADIRNFTTISEGLTAAQLKEMLNEFFTPMTEIIFKYQGTIDKYVGDLIMAFWGAPLKDRKHAKHAISAALEMQATVEKLKPIFTERGWPEINIGVGLNTGTMSVGDMGSSFRRNYTVLGDAVNLGSRVEGLTKFYGIKIMATESTIEGQNQFLFRQLDRVRVKGKKAGVNIFEVVCKLRGASDDLLQEVTLSNEALDFYFNQEWDRAEQLFQQLLAKHPASRFYQLYAARIAEFKKTPPAAGWDGIYIHGA